MADALDADVIVQLRDLLGDDFGTLVNVFLADSAARMKDMEQAIGTADCERSQRAAHALKGMCSNMGAITLSNASGALEAAARGGSATTLSPLWQTVRDEYARVRAAAEALVSH